MNLLLHLVSRLYPAWWRERYGDEFSALLYEAQPGIGGVLDILKGALAMQFSTHGNFLRIIGLTTVIGLVVGSIFGLAMEHQFRSTATVQTHMPENATSQDTLESFRRMARQVLSSESLLQIAENRNLYPSLDGTELLERMKEGIEIQVPDKQDRISAFAISFVYPDRTVANSVVQDLTSRFLDTSVEQSEQAMGEGRESGISTQRVFNSASLPDTAILPAWGKMLTTGFLGGLGLGFVVILFRRPTSRGNWNNGNGVGAH